MKSSSDTEQLNVSLLHYQGWSAMLYAYSPTFRRIIIIIFKNEANEEEKPMQEIFLLCLNCLSYSGPIDWRLGQMKVTVQFDEQRIDPLSQLIDQAAGFELVCDGGISLITTLPDY